MISVCDLENICLLIKDGYAQNSFWVVLLPEYLTPVSRNQYLIIGFSVSLLLWLPNSWSEVEFGKVNNTQHKDLK